MSEKITILRAYPSQVMTKTYTPTGVIVGDTPKYFEVKEKEVSSLADLSVILTKLEKEPRCCIIRGLFKGEEHARSIPDRVDAKGLFARKRDIFEDPARHFIMIDVDGYVPDGVVPCKDPVKAAEMYIERYLPEEFQNVSFHWQLSSSAGSLGKEHILKVHLWFWLNTPYKSSELTSWAKAVNESKGVKAIDVAPLRVVQAHFTADPIMKDGAVDPVKVRSGFVTGFMGDEVYLTIDDVTLLRAIQFQAEEEGYEFKNPAEKPGVIGAFHRAYTVEDVLNELLPDEFEMEPGSERRVTWLNGGGTPGGCFITEDRQHFGSTHNTDAFDNRVVNLFDLVRHYKFGDLDTGLDAFELFDMRDRPSYQAMVDWCYKDARVTDQLEIDKVEARTERAHRVEIYRTVIADAVDAYALEQDVCAAIANDRALIESERIQLAKIVQDRAQQLIGTKPSIAVIREWIAPAAIAGGFQDVNEGGLPLCTIPNVHALLLRLNGSVRYNVMTKEEELMLPGHNFSIDNKANASLSIVLSEAASVQMPTALIKGHLLQIADSNQYNPMMTWINSKPWDGVSRLQQLFDTLVVEDRLKDLRDMLVRKWLLSAVHGAASPVGVSAQGMLVLTGKQYKGKTRWFKSLVGGNEDMFREGVTLDPKDKDSVKIAVSAWITELGELDATFRKADIAALKAFITKQQDIFRKPFAAAESKFVRRTAFGGTVNDESYLRDPSGNRRFYTIPVLDVDHNHTIDMQQLWVEVYETMYLTGEQHWLTQEWLVRLNSHNEDHTEVHPVNELVSEKLDFEADKIGWVWSSASSVCDRLGISPDRGNATLVGKVLRELGCDKKKTNGVRLIHTPPIKVSEFI